MKNFLFLPISLLLATPSYADEGATSRADGLTHLRLTAMVPGIMVGNYDLGLDAGVALDLRVQPLVIGVFGSLAKHGGTEWLAGVHVGYGMELTPDLTFDVLGEFGRRQAYSRGDGNFFSDDPGTGTSEFFAGLRIALDYAVNSPSDAVTFRIGLSVFGRLALSGAQDNTYSYDQCSSFNLFDDGDDCQRVEKTARVGGVNDVGATLNLSLDFGAW